VSSVIECDGMSSGRYSLGHLTQCPCKAKYKVSQVKGSMIRHVCGRHVLTFRAAIKQGLLYRIEEIGNDIDVNDALQ
jgi:hypothetical protein